MNSALQLEESYIRNVDNTDSSLLAPLIKIQKGSLTLINSTIDSIVQTVQGSIVHPIIKSRDCSVTLIDFTGSNFNQNFFQFINSDVFVDSSLFVNGSNNRIKGTALYLEDSNLEANHSSFYNITG